MNAKKKPVFDLVQGIAPLVLIATFSNLQVSKTGKTSEKVARIIQYALGYSPLCAKMPNFELVRSIP